MIAPETGREIPADELVERLRRRLDKWRHTGPDRKPWLNAPLAEIRAMDDMLARSVARIASLEAERARAVEAYRAGVEETCREWATPESWSDAESTQQGLDDRKRAAWVRTEMMKDWRVARALTLASEKGGQADG